MLVTTDEAFGKAVIEAVESELQVLETAEIARKSWETYGEVVVVDDIQEAVDLVNDYAPEHLELNLKIQKKLLKDLSTMVRCLSEKIPQKSLGTMHLVPITPFRL